MFSRLPYNKILFDGRENVKFSQRRLTAHLTQEIISKDSTIVFEFRDNLNAETKKTDIVSSP